MALVSSIFAVALVFAARAAEPENAHGSCGNVLLQSHQALQRRCDDPDAAHAAGWLGWGRWVAKEDMWHMTGLRGESLFARHMPGSCFKEADCRHVHSFKSQNFNSVETWSSFYSSSFGLGVSGGYSGFSASVDASMGSTASSSGRVSKRLAYAAQSSQRKCYRLIRDDLCAYNKSNLQPALLQRLAAMPTGSPYSVEKMEAWKVSFIQRFGTHITLGSAHGALVQSLASVDARSELSSDCMEFGLCSKFGWVGAGNAGLNLCSNTSRCDNSSKSSESEKSTCVAVGGNPTLQSKVCQTDVSQETLESWLDGGDVDDGSSAYRYSFMPLAEFLTNVDFEEFSEAALTLGKAVEYSNCRIGQNPPVEAWEDSRCRCVRTCENGGTLDPAACTCKCKGSAKHGWTGPTCSETYGSCQAGVGTGNLGAARRCPAAGKCASWHDSHICKATDVCCATNVGTKCCPFGSSCDCTSTNCACRTG